jgi:hypothetical protein
MRSYIEDGFFKTTKNLLLHYRPNISIDKRVTCITFFDNSKFDKSGYVLEFWKYATKYIY